MGLVPGSGFGLVNIKGCFMCVVTRIFERLVLEDRARGCSASGSSEYR